jgi:hypothetical protein
VAAGCCGETVAAFMHRSAIGRETDECTNAVGAEGENVEVSYMFFVQVIDSKTTDNPV